VRVRRLRRGGWRESGREGAGGLNGEEGQRTARTSTRARFGGAAAALRCGGGGGASSASPLSLSSPSGSPRFFGAGFLSASRATAAAPFSPAFVARAAAGLPAARAGFFAAAASSLVP